MHSHLIPGIDDGSKSIDESIAMLAKFESLGYKKVITTPHIMSDYFRNTPEIIMSGLDDVRNEVSKLNLNIEIDAAAEYYFDESLMERLNKKEKLLTFGDNYILFEFSFHSEPNQIDKLIFELLTQGYRMGGQVNDNPDLQEEASYWNSGTSYRTGDVVRFGGWLYIALRDNTGTEPDDQKSTVDVTITVGNPGDGNKYYVDGVLAGSISLVEGNTYRFIQNDSSNLTHPLYIS